MKVGMRKPSIKKSIKASTTGKAKRAVKGAVNPLYGKKGMGWVNDPKKATYNKVYNKTTVGVRDITKTTFEEEGNSSSSSAVSGCGCGCLAFVVIMFILIFIIF